MQPPKTIARLSPSSGFGIGAVAWERKLRSAGFPEADGLGS
jgi:hypothetical protein